MQTGPQTALLADVVKNRRESEVLGSALVAVQLVGKSQARTLNRIKSMQGCGGEKNLHLIVLSSHITLYFNKIGVAQGMALFRTEVGHFLNPDAVGGLGKEDKVVAKAGSVTGALHVARVKKELHAISLSVVWIERLLKGLIYFY